MQFEEATISGTDRRSERLDKNKSINIPTTKHTEYRLPEAFRELPKDKSTKKVTPSRMCKRR